MMRRSRNLYKKQKGKIKMQELVIHTEYKPEVDLAVNKTRDIELNISINTEGKHSHAHSPVETVIGALGSCLLINVRRYFKVHNLDLSDMKMTLKGVKDPSIPKLIRIEYLLEIYGSKTFDTNELKTFIETKSTTYNTLKDSVSIDGEIRKR